MAPYVLHKQIFYSESDFLPLLSTSMMLSRSSTNWTKIFVTSGIKPTIKEKDYELEKNHQS